MQILRALLVLLLPGVLAPGALLAQDATPPDARTIVTRAIEHWRDVSSYSVFDMVIHRPDWERSMRMRIWTKGLKSSLVRVTAPPKDAGNATLIKDDEMWSFTPKINRIIKIPSSMMHQSWMGSDFSNNDVSRADDIIDQYDHRLLQTEQQDGHAVYTIESVPHDAAPVVWGREVLRVRDDYVMLQHDFYDQEGRVVKRMLASDIREVSGKTVATVERMNKVDKPEEWTEIRLIEAQYGIDVPPATFTLSNLRNPRS
ncbi:MAG: outer membrane lipoprotein-sorting protein [Chromatiales bacterium]|jgi:outer membrane lipoprotein-sorting protein